MYGLVVITLLCNFFPAGSNTWRLTIFFDFLNVNRQDLGKGFREKTRWRKGVGRVGEGIEVTAVLYEVHWRLLLTVLLFSVHL